MKRKTVLCVDDETQILNSLKRVLRRENYDLLTAVGGAEALKVLERETVHVVITDQRMPGMTGVELLAQIKERWPHIVRIVLSGYADAGVMMEAINNGEIFRFLAKPWDDDELKAAICDALNQYDAASGQDTLLVEADRRNRELAAACRDLEDEILARTKSLELNREILAELPTPVLCVGREGFLISANRRARECYPALREAPAGTPVRRIFPKDVSSLVLRWLEGDPPEEMPAFDWNGRRIRLRVQTLTEDDLVRGCVLTLEDV
jgi:FixJ family two-component response regulator